VEPQPGTFDEGALGRYRRLVDHLARIGVEPVVTLFHYTHPRWFHALSPWTSPRSVEAFARFAAAVAEALGPAARIYTVLNEPLVFVLGGFLDGQIPPGLSDGRAAALALENLLAAHVAAAGVIRRANPDAAIGIAHNMMSFAPERPWNPFDRLLARHADRLYNDGILQAFRTGRWDFRIPPFVRFKGRLDLLPSSLDFFGVNFYSRLHLRSPGRRRFVGDFGYLDRTGRGLTDNGWEIVPEAFEELLRRAAGLGLPLLVTENGLADEDDSRRARFLEEHAAVLERLAGELPLLGYLHWSLVDNYEWLDGYGPKFGLCSFDPLTWERRPRPSAATFAALGRRFVEDARTAEFTRS
jgi:beta-glucosidase